MAVWPGLGSSDMAVESATVTSHTVGRRREFCPIRRFIRYVEGAHHIPPPRNRKRSSSAESRDAV